MALKKKGGRATLQRHYEKLIVVAVLIGLLVSLLYLSQSAYRRQRDHVEFNSGLSGLTKRFPTARTVDPAPYERAQSRLATPFQMAPATNRTFLVAQERVWCVECRQPILFDTDVCPLCRAEQPAPEDAGLWDADGDGIPDEIERKYGLNPLDPADAHHDLDGDGFTNAEEFLAGTDMVRPSSHPPRVAFLRVREIAAMPFPLLLRGTVRGAGGTLRYQINDRASGQTHVVTVGQAIGNTGYVLLESEIRKDMRQNPGWPAPREVDVHVVTVGRGDSKVVLQEGAPPTSTDYVVTLVNLKDRAAVDYTARPGEPFRFDDEAFEVNKIDIARRTAVIRRVSDNQEIVVPPR